MERELLRNEFEGMGGVIRDSLIDQEVNRTILTTFNGDRSAFLKNLSLSGMTIRAFREMTKKQLQVQIMRTAITCILAPLSIPLPFSPVPISLTNLVIFISVFILGMKDATISFLIYLLLPSERT